MDFCPFSKTPCSLPKIYHVTDIFGKEVVQMHLCQKCFLNQYSIATQENIANFIAAVIKEKERIFAKKCSQCNSSLGDINKSGRLGCPGCYDSFQEELLPVLQRCQGGNLVHIGKKPHDYKIIEAKEEKLDIKERIRLLKLKMANAIEVENYEIAGVLKKKIEELSSES